MEFGRKVRTAEIWIRKSSEPVTAIGKPPTRNTERDCGEQGPPERQDEVRNQPRDAPGDPEDLLLHGTILGLKLSLREKQIFRFAQDDNPEAGPTRLMNYRVGLARSYCFGQAIS
jgi:hypothetical protein